MFALSLPPILLKTLSAFGGALGDGDLHLPPHIQPIVGHTQHLKFLMEGMDLQRPCPSISCPSMAPSRQMAPITQLARHCRENRAQPLWKSCQLPVSERNSPPRNERKACFQFLCGENIKNT